MTTTEITRRQFLASASATLIAHTATPATRQLSAKDELSRELAKIELASGGRLGVAVLDTATGSRTLHRGDERFPMCSTFKLVACAAVLAKVDAGKQSLDQRITFQKTDLVTYSPITQTHTGAPGMTLAEICAAAIDYSDNTAANLILANIGGPAGFTQFARSLGDTVTRLDRIETALNESLPNDPRDTTTPSAMVGNLNSLLLGNTLSPASRDQLIQWLLANTTGGTRLRAGVPANWRIGDKTGTGDRGSTNDIGILWPPNAKPLLVCAYLTGTTVSLDQRNATIAAVGRAVSESVHP
ncbi:MAG: beta-lactamase [Edaphobacter sp.]|nr:beta-lactamase [Edaphobacter sp.]